MGVAFLFFGWARILGLILITGVEVAAFFFAIALWAWLILRWGVSQWFTTLLATKDGLRATRRNGRVLDYRWVDRTWKGEIDHYREGGPHLAGLWITLSGRRRFGHARITDAGLQELRRTAEGGGLTFERVEVLRGSGADWRMALVDLKPHRAEVVPKSN